MTISDQVKALLAELGTTKCKKGKTWKGYTVYIPAYSGDPCIGLPYVILEKNGETRICDDEECFEYLDYSLGEEDD
jgi:hypothetical protein